MINLRLKLRLRSPGVRGGSPVVWGRPHSWNGNGYGYEVGSGSGWGYTHGNGFGLYPDYAILELSHVAT